MLVEDLFEFLAAKLFRSNMPLNWKKKNLIQEMIIVLWFYVVKIPKCTLYAKDTLNQNWWISKEIHHTVHHYRSQKTAKLPPIKFGDPKDCSPGWKSPVA